MAYWKILKKAISDVIKANDNQEITGELLQQALLSIISNVGENATFAGVATPSTSPGFYDGPKFWIASEPGIYPNFSSIRVPENTLGIIYKTDSNGASYDANSIKRPGLALDNNGRVISNGDFTSLVFSASANDNVQLPSASSVGATAIAIKILKSDGSVDKSVGDLTEDSSTFISPTAGTVWAGYYKPNTGSAIVFQDGAKVAVGILGDFSVSCIDVTKQIRTEIVNITSAISKINSIIVALEEAYGVKIYDANSIKRPGLALDNNGKVISHGDFTSLVFSASANDNVQLPSASSVGATAIAIKILKSDGSVDKSVGDLTEDSSTFISPATGTVWAGYYKPDTGSTITFQDGASVTVGTGEQTATHKKVLWIGTSIPAGNGTINGTYPLQVKRNLELNTLYNNSIGGSGIVKNTGYLGNGRDGIDLTETVAEKEERYRAKVLDGTISEATLNIYKNSSYERLVMPYINGQTDACDVVIIDHGYNDRDQLSTEINDQVSLSNKDRSTFIGAFNYLVDKIYSVNPKIQIIVVSFYMKDNYNGQGWEMHGKDIDTVLKKLSGFYNFMYIPTYDGSCINPANFLSMCPDTVHPHSDAEGTAVKNIADYLTNSLRDIL